MTRTASQKHPATEPGHAQKPQALSISLEVLGSLVALAAIPLFFFNWLDVYLVFFGETPTVEDWNVTAYRVALGILAAGTVMALGACYWRRFPLGRSAYWHGFVLILGIAAALVFHVGFEHSSPAPPPAQESHPVCFGDTGDCPGG
jgi:hypothetical protein